VRAFWEAFATDVAITTAIGYRTKIVSGSIMKLTRKFARCQDEPAIFADQRARVAGEPLFGAIWRSKTR
jgi:hypothetical protein